MTSIQLLSCRVEIEHDDPEVERVFRYISAYPRQDVPVRKTLRYEVRGGSPFEILEEGDLVDVVETADAALFTVYMRARRRALERFVLSGWVNYHGAVVEVHGRRMLILGEPGAGKSTLATRLLFSGHAVEGDELALERGGEVVAFPRPLLLKPGIERQAPELASVLHDLPKRSVGDVQKAALDPSALGWEWHTSARPIDELVWITPNHGGATTMRRAAPFDAIRCLLQGAPGLGESRQALVASATRVGRRGGHELILGDAYEGVRSLERCASEPT